MNPQSFKILDFDLLRTLVRRGAQTENGRARIDVLEPLGGLGLLQRELQLVDEATALRARGVRFSFDGIADVTESISRLRIEGTALEPLTLLDIAHVCECAMDARAAILAERDSCPNLFEVVAALPRELTGLTTLLRKKILPSGEVDDRASPQLAGIRRELANARSRITRSLEALMRKSSEAIQEELVTVRNDRFVIPVRADHQGRIKGVAHGSSSSGATVFVEPLDAIEANNELQTLREVEQREIAEILFRLSEELRRNLPDIESAARAISELDFINAKAVFGRRFDCVVPLVSEPRAIATGSSTTAPGSDTTLEFVDARHPLLEESLRATGESVAPVSFTLDGDHTTMIISGANAGGKTVVLKTAGLLSLMALSGLPVPAKQASVPFYRSVLVDIGDHQSLAANLSTFTSHVGNIAGMIEACETPALVLLDEVGTGTDPEEGSALGVAVVDHFKQSGAHVLATTHYSGLKMYAANEPGVLNASVEFDEKTLRPTFRLLVGLAGSSSGLEIARRFGIPDVVISNANDQVKQTSRDAAEYLRRIKREAEEAAELRIALEEERAAVAEKFATLDKQFQRREAARQREFEKQIKEVIADFERMSRELAGKIEDGAVRAKVEREAATRAAELKREAQRIAKESRTPARVTGVPESEVPKQLRGVKVIRDGKVVSDDLPRPVEVEAVATSRRTARAASDSLHVGDRVRLCTLGSVGVIDRIKGGEAEVRVGSLHMREKLSNLELIDEASNQADEVRTARVSGRVKASLEDLRRQSRTTEVHLHSKDSDSKSQTLAELNLIGKKTDEAVDLVDKFLDQAFLNGQSEVRIIHGHGTGALRKAIAELLADHPHVARFAAASQDHGGAGATVVELRT